MSQGLLRLRPVLAVVVLLAASPAVADKIEENRPDFPQGERNSDIRDDIRGIFGFGPRTPPGDSGFRATPTPNVDPRYQPPPRSITRTTAPSRVTVPTAAGVAPGSCARSELDEASLLELQRLLNFIWGSEAEGAGRPDGRCGQRTVRAVTALQRAHGREADGVPSRDVLQLARSIVSGAPADGVAPAEAAPARSVGH